MNSNTIKILGTILWLTLAIWGIIGVINRFQHGHTMANYGSYIPWGLWVAGYVYFIGLSAGAFLLSSLINVFKIEKLRSIGRVSLIVAAITLVMALLSISFDLGHMDRAYKVFTNPNFSSMMTWMVWLYAGYLILIFVELWYEMRCDLATLADKGGRLSFLYRTLTFGWKCPDKKEEYEVCHNNSRKMLRVLGMIGIPLAIAFHGGVGALFATPIAHSYWHTGLLPIIFLTGALLSGGALLLFGISVYPKIAGTNKQQILNTLAKIVLGLLVLDLLLEWAEFSVTMWYGQGPDMQLLKTMLFGEYWYVFWVFHIILGSAIPLYLLAKKQVSRFGAAAGGFLIAATFLAVRLNIVVPALTEPQLLGLERAYLDARLVFEYFPSMFEWSVMAFIVALGWGVFVLAKRFLPMNELEHTFTS